LSDALPPAFREGLKIGEHRLLLLALDKPSVWVVTRRIRENVLVVVEVPGGCTNVDLIVVILDT
jgi:uncharacterized membrane protein YsdA (DUF1294 family)